MPTTLTADGSSEQDAHPRVTINMAVETDRWRYRCPNGHRGKAWSPTNSHVYCRNCKQQMDNGDDVSPEHYVLYDVKTDEEIPYGAIRFIDT